MLIPLSANSNICEFWVGFYWLVYLLLWLVFSCCFACLVNFECRILLRWMLDSFLSCFLELGYGVWLFGNSLILSGFALLGRTKTVLSCGLFVLHHWGKTSVYSTQCPMNLVWLVGVVSMPRELRALLIFSGHSFLNLEQFPTRKYLRGSLWRSPAFSLYVALSSLILCPMNCSHLGLPGYFALSPQLYLPSSTWVSSPYTEA